MKKSILLTGALMLMMASCSNEEILPNEEVKNNNAEPTLTIIATQGEDASSRLAFEDEMQLAWTPGDQILVTEAQEPQNYLLLTLQETEQTKTGTFSTTDALPVTWDETTELVAYYKSDGLIIYDYEETHNLLRFFDAGYEALSSWGVYTGQTTNGDMEHLTKLNNMVSEETFTLSADVTELNLKFNQQGAILKFTLTGLGGNTVTKLNLSAGEEIFLGGHHNGQAMMESAVSLPLGTDYSGITLADNEVLTAYMVMGPTDATEGKTMTLTATTTDGEYTATVTGGKLEAGMIYSISKAMEKVVLPMGNKTAEQAVKGDLAMADGTFISKDDIEELTDEQKANVRGVVFWTEKNDKVYTYSSLAYDEIMITDFPTCTHGLIVALNNVATGCKWQDPNASVVAWQTNTFSDANKSDYKQIAAINGETDNLKYILGYQNTKLLKAYNKYCSETTGMSGYIVKPVAELATWEATPGNEAPANTTGWFIPSAKELHMLCYKDVLYNRPGTTTYKAINPLIKALGGTELGETELGGAEMGEKKNYWSSTERRDDTGFAYQIYFNDGSFSRNGKYGLAYVRAVCAF